MRILFDSLKAAAGALQHARWQLRHATALLAKHLTQPSARVRGAVVDALGAIRFASRSVSTSQFAFENLLAIWLAHSVVDPTLRLSDEDIRTLAEQPAMKDAFASNEFTRSLLRQLTALGVAETY